MTNNNEKEEKRGRPKIELDWKLLDSILEFGARCIDCAGILECSEDTIQTKIKESFGMTFSEYRLLKMSKMRTRLLQKQVDVALKGNVAMLIWLGKQVLHQTEKQEISQTITEKPLKLSKEERLEMVEIYKEQLSNESDT